MLAWSSGCVTPPPAPPIAVRSPASQTAIENPLWLPSGPNAYGAIFEKIEDIMTEYFEIRYSNRYDGRIDTFPKVCARIRTALATWQPRSSMADCTPLCRASAIAAKCRSKRPKMAVSS